MIKKHFRLWFLTKSIMVIKEAADCNYTYHRGKLHCYSLLCIVRWESFWFCNGTVLFSLREKSRCIAPSFAPFSKGALTISDFISLEPEIAGINAESPLLTEFEATEQSDWFDPILLQLGALRSCRILPVLDMLSSNDLFSNGSLWQKMLPALLG